jgi:hypothetical protein
MFRLTFFCYPLLDLNQGVKKKGYKKEVGERAARPLSIRLCAFSVDKFVKT